MNWRKKKDNSQVVTSSQPSPFDKIPVDLKDKILMKLKAKQISKFIIVSKSWSSIVRRKYFTNFYLSQSMTQPQILLYICPQDGNMPVFYSSSQEDPYSFHNIICCNSPNRKWYDFSPSVRGLISCLNKKSEVMVGNPSICQFTALPRVKTLSKDIDIRSFFGCDLRKDIIHFFGYDPVADVYKVLYMTSSCCNSESEDCVSKNHQVFTLGDSEKKWKMIKCEHPHYVHPKTQGIYNNGVVYYLALINKFQSLICFDVGSEKFNVIKLPIDPEDLTLLNFGEKIVVTDRDLNGTLNLWVLEDASNQEWLKIPIVIPAWSFLYRNSRMFKLRGILGRDELLFAPRDLDTPYYLICYDLKKKKVKKIEIKGVEIQRDSLEIFLNHVETPIFLQV